jgi:hypothetical protein
MSTTAASLVGKVGPLTENPELRFGRSGIAFATFGLAVKPWTPTAEQSSCSQPLFG